MPQSNKDEVLREKVLNALNATLVRAGSVHDRATAVITNQELDAVMHLITEREREVRQSLLAEIAERVIGGDEDDEVTGWTPEMATVISETRRIIYGRNALRAQQRNLLKDLEEES